MKVGEPIFPRPTKGLWVFDSSSPLSLTRKQMTPLGRANSLVTGRGKIMPPKLARDAIRSRGRQVIVEPSKMKPFVFYPVSLEKENLLIYKTPEGKIIIYEDLPPRSAK